MLTELLQSEHELIASIASGELGVMALERAYDELEWTRRRIEELEGER